VLQNLFLGSSTHLTQPCTFGTHLYTSLQHIDLAFITPALLCSFWDSIVVAITDVFREKNGINVSNKFVKILKIFTKIYDIKNRGVIYRT